MRSVCLRAIVGISLLCAASEKGLAIPIATYSVTDSTGTVVGALPPTGVVDHSGTCDGGGTFRDTATIGLDGSSGIIASSTGPCSSSISANLVYYFELLASSSSLSFGFKVGFGASNASGTSY